MKTITTKAFKTWQTLPVVATDTMEPPRGLGVRQSSDALEVVGGRKRQRTGALQDADARKGAANSSDASIFHQP